MDILQYIHDLEPLAAQVFDLFETRIGRIILSFSLIFLAVLVNRAMRWQLLRHHHQPEEHTPIRAKWVRRKNMVWVTTMLLILALWSNQITGVLISLAAIAGAMLIVSKELILCLWGALIISLNKTLKIGSTIEVGKFTGQLVNTGFLTFELAEIGPSKKQTGRLLQLPNSIVFTEPLKNLSTYGEFGIHLIDFHFDMTVNLEQAEGLALSLATDAAKLWIESAALHFSMIERSNFVELPNARPEIFWTSVDEKCLRMTLRFACPLNRRGQIEKMIIKRFWCDLAKEKANSIHPHSIPQE
jgi:small-conductance mechanosensitive channel